MKKMTYGKRLKIASENKAIVKQGFYNCSNGTVVKLNCSRQSLKTKTSLKTPILLPDISRSTKFNITENTRKNDTISCVLSLRNEGITGEIIALNFANALFAGGGYRLGGDAQEESLCRCSLLYFAILPHTEYYNKHRVLPFPLYSNRMLISDSVPVIRNMNGDLLTEPTVCTFITCAAVNRYYSKLLFIPEKKIKSVMEERINGIICAMAERNPEAIVLGAFGCGMYGNKRKVIIPMIENAINRWITDEVKVVFAQP